MVYENNEVQEKNGWKYKEQKLAIDTGDRVNDINIQQAIVHVLDNNGAEPILNNYTEELTEDTYKFLYRHMEKLLKSDDLKFAVFNEDRNLVKETVKGYLNWISDDFVELSQNLARQLFCIMRSNVNIEPAYLVVSCIITDQGPLIAILKMDYTDRFSHSIEFIENKVGIKLVKEGIGLPSSSSKIQKAAFIKPIREDNKFDLWIIDKQKRIKDDDEYGANYFTNSFLGCYEVMDNRTATKTFMNAAERWTRSNVIEDAAKAEEIRSTIKEELEVKDVINIDSIADKIFKEEPKAKEEFSTFIKGHGLEDEIKVDKRYVEKKLKRVRLKVDTDIDLYISQEAYKDPSKFEIKRNGDGSINMVIKHVINYIEK